MMDLQWPALVLSIAGAWCVGGSTSRLRLVGFWLFLVSNLCWAGWGMAVAAPAIVIAQVFFMYTSVRGIVTNRSPMRAAAIIPQPAPPPPPPPPRGGYQALPRLDYPRGTLPPPPVGRSGKT